MAGISLLERHRVRGRLADARAEQLVPFLALVVVVLAFAGTDGFLSFDNLENILRTLPVTLLVAVGVTFVILAGSIDISVAGIMTLGAAVGVTLVPDLGEVGLLVAPVVGAAVGAVNGVLVAYVRLPSFLVTLGTLFVFQGGASLVLGGVPHPYVGPTSVTLTAETISLGGVLEVTYITVLALAVIGVAILFAKATRAGHYIYALGGGEPAARAAGIRIERYKVLVLGPSGMFAGLAGMVLAMRSQAATPLMGDPFLLTSIAAVVVGGTSLLGGVGGPQWTVLGALIIIVLDNGMVLAGVNPDYQTVIRGLVIVAAAGLTLRRVGIIK